ncbi:hypothetical protein P4V33_24175, partial [Brevibacillus borstelensis]|uniref:hypothetical protein n=1 Tax=Brevibacillus borstelensis TaxID=45462 RepID=UPI002E1DD4DE|nr:hypothetical protein [Brevibacillus borstelensis]
RDHEKVTHPTGGLIFAMVVNFLMSTVVNILVDIHTLRRQNIDGVLWRLSAIPRKIGSIKLEANNCGSIPSFH